MSSPAAELVRPTEGLDDEVLDVISRVTKYSDYQDEHFIPSDAGEQNHVLIGENIIIKMPRRASEAEHPDPYSARLEQQRQARFESFLIAILQDAETPPPLVIPHGEVWDNRQYPYYSGFNRLPGEVFSQDAIRAFSRTEKQGLGRRIGRFIAWMGSEISFNAYQEVTDVSGYKPLDRNYWIDRWGHHARFSINGTTELNALLLDIADEMYRLQDQGKLKRTIIGHYDLRPAGNTTYVRRADNWSLEGVFDFGLVQPSTPECELRHLAPFPEALEAGVIEYEAITGTSLSGEVLKFWGLAQATIAMAGMLKSGNTAGAAVKMKDLKQILPPDRWRQVSNECVL